MLLLKCLYGMVIGVAVTPFAVAAVLRRPCRSEGTSSGSPYVSSGDRFGVPETFFSSLNLLGKCETHVSDVMCSLAMLCTTVSTGLHSLRFRIQA
jgi:hypothetical protein